MSDKEAAFIDQHIIGNELGYANVQYEFLSFSYFFIILFIFNYYYCFL